MAKDQKKGTGNWKPLPADPGPQKIVGEVAPVMPIDPQVTEKLRQDPQSVPAVPTEIGGGSNVQKKKSGGTK